MCVLICGGWVFVCVMWGVVDVCVGCGRCVWG